ncbi:MAG: sigma-70 family RNA polymerase sigma factor [Bacilli bacterium]|nr:sigma-70 family RNA polymerase sigma factor [Bacilli bacterium]
MKPDFRKRLHSITCFTKQSTIDSLFEDLYATYAGLLGFVLASFDLDDDAKRDIINEAFFNLYLNRNKVEDVKYYLISSVKNKAINELKRRQRFVTLDDYYDYFSVSSVQQETEAKVVMEQLLESMTDEEKQLFNLYIIENMTSAEVAEILKMNSNTVRTKWNRLLAKIKRIL